MRLLPPVKQAEILQEACHFIRRHTAYKIDEPSDVGPCGSSIRIITGEEEGLFGWIAVNYLMDGFTGRHQDRTTYGFLDMGGASTQIAFEPTVTDEKDAKDLIDVRLRLLGGQEITHKVFVTTWLGYGTNQARERYLDRAVSGFQRHGEVRGAVPDPCLPKDLQLSEPGPDDETHSLVGTGSFEQCLLDTAPLLNKTAPCPDSPCLMNGIHVPKIDFSVSHFIGVSEYWYSSDHIFGLGGAYDFVQYERAASKFCSRTWDEIMHQHERLKQEHRLGGDGEVEEDGKIVEVGKWDPNVERSRLEMQCFKAAWITNVLHEGIGLPRLMDPGGNTTATEGSKVEKQAETKGLGKPAFQSMDSVGDLAITWTLGKMVLEASKEVRPLTNSRPLVDPIDDIPDRPGFHIQPIRPPFFDLIAIEDRLSVHLPVALTRSSLGFSPVLFLLLVTFFVFMLVAYPLRRQFRATCLRSLRHVTKRHEEYSLEEGTLFNGHLRPSTPSSAKTWLYPIRRVISFSRSKPPLAIPTFPNPRHVPNGSTKRSPTRSYSFPMLESVASSTQYARGSISRTSSPSSPTLEEVFLHPSGNGALSLQRTLSSSRSRNASQMTLSSVSTRSSISRSGSIMISDD